MRCCTAPSWSAICTSARSAATTCASRARERLARFLDPGTGVEIGADVLARGSAAIQGQQALQGPACRRAEGHRREGRADRHGRHACTASRSWPARSSSRSSAVRWARWWASASTAPSNAASRIARRWCASRPPAARACRRRCCRCCRWPRPARRWRGWPQAHLPYISVLTDPDHRWRVGQPRDARRHQHRRAARADRLRRSARDRADRARDAAGRLPAQRVPAGEGRDRPDHRPARHARSRLRACCAC